jgi:hypothetical protein
LNECFRIRVRKGELEFEVQGTENFVVDQYNKLNRLLHLEQDQVILEEKKISLGEFLDKMQPKAHTEEIVLFAYYSEKMLHKLYFNVTDISDLYSKSKVKSPANINDTINGLVRKGLLIESDEEKENLKCWTISRSGIELVKSRMKEK